MNEYRATVFHLLIAADVENDKVRVATRQSRCGG